MTSRLRSYVRQRNRMDDDLRDEVCASMPGGPDGYKLRVKTTCVPLVPAAPKKRAKAKISDAANRRELLALEAEVRGAGDVEVGQVGEVDLQMLEDMMSPAQRVRQPDPSLRFDDLAEKYRDATGEDFFSSREARYFVMRTMLSHVRTLTGGVSRRRQDKKKKIDRGRSPTV